MTVFSRVINLNLAKRSHSSVLIGIKRKKNYCRRVETEFFLIPRELTLIYPLFVERAFFSDGEYLLAVYVLSRRGKPMVLYNGKRFRLCAQRGLKSRWRCAVASCRAFVHTINDSIVSVHDEHDHD